MEQTKFGEAANNQTIVGLQAYEALIRDDGHIVGGEEATQQEAVGNITAPGPSKAVPG